MKKGFTLVELSLVLVIIGLLVGGILAAQSMIKTTKLNGIIKQVSQLDIAVANFKTKYNQLPGDTILLTNPGNNDGLVQVSPTEYLWAWYHLSLGVGLKNALGGDYGAVNGSKATCPRFDIDNADVNNHCLIMVVNTFSGETKNYFRDRVGGGGVNLLLPADAYVIDSKMDNGIATTGKVLTNSGAACYTATLYNVTSSAYACTLYFQVGLVNGEL